ncbi:MAG: metallophosphoesterase [Trueperaceae bacterium]|nr:metallophosphoesterase [Trueperaceae bacterium]
MAHYVIGDIHGEYDKYTRHLIAHGLASDTLSWRGGSDHLWVMGDFFDRGPEGLQALELTIKLQLEAADAGGAVHALIGNHDVLMIAAKRFGGGYYDYWQTIGGVADDLAGLTDRHLAWLMRLPALRRAHSTLFMHADAKLYLNYGDTIDAVNEAFYKVVSGDDQEAFDALIEAFGEHRGFVEGVGEPQNAKTLLDTFGGSRIVHGHSPIEKTTDQDSPDITEAFVYNNGLCVNVDGGMYRGGPGFVYTLPETD